MQLEEKWNLGRVPELETDDLKENSFKGTNIKRGDKLKVKGPLKRAITYDYNNCWDGPKIYDSVILTADYILISPDGYKYVSTYIDDKKKYYRFIIDYVEETWYLGRIPELENEDLKKNSFEGTKFKQGDKLKVKDHVIRAVTYNNINSWNGPQIYNSVILIADYILILPGGYKYISTFIDDKKYYYRFMIDDVELL